MDKMIFFTTNRYLWADVNKHILGGRLIVQIKVGTNVKLVCATSNILADVYFDSIDENYMLNLHDRGGANIYAASGDNFYSMFSINLN